VKLYILLGCLLALVACAKQAPPPVIPHASLDDCQRVYQQILNDIMAEKIDPNINMSLYEYTLAEQEIDYEFQKSGSKDKFFLTCQAYMTPAQVECAMRAHRVVEMNICIRSFPSKKQ
jgi:hypothetical protein